MTLTLGPVIGQVGGATWDETPVQEIGLGRLEYRTVTPPPPTEAVVVVAALNLSVDTGSTSGSVRIGNVETEFLVGEGIVAGVLRAGEVVQVRGGSSYRTWSFSGTIYTMPLPG